jgi:hypothetical protein
LGKFNAKTQRSQDAAIFHPQSSILAGLVGRQFRTPHSEIAV